VVTLRGMTTRQQNVDASRLKRLTGGRHGWELTNMKTIHRLSQPRVRKREVQLLHRLLVRQRL
jgi:hypothetical protein